MSTKQQQASISSNQSRSHRHVVVIAVVAFFILVGLLVLGLSLLKYDGGRYGGLGLRTIEILIQTVAATLGGGLLIQAYVKWHSREQAIVDFRRTLLDGLINDYLAAKGIRRLLRAAAEQRDGGTDENPWTHLSIEAYSKHVTQLNETELSLEVLHRRVKIFASVFPDATSLAADVKEMHDYLENVIEEFEHSRRHVGKGPEHVDIAALPQLSGFMLRKGLSTFHGFADPYHRLLKALQNAVVRISL